MLSYKYVSGNIDVFRRNFEKIIINPGQGVQVDDYYRFLIEKKDAYDIAVQYDVPGDMFMNKKLYEKAINEKVPNVIPVLHVNYLQAITGLGLNEDDMVALGKMRGNIEEDEQIKRLSPRFKYHGLAKGRLIRNRMLSSIDSSMWLSGARGRKTQTLSGVTLFFGIKGRQGVSALTQACNNYKEELNICKIRTEDIMHGTYHAILKAPIAFYYRPLLKSINSFDDNFTF